jgi:hypothetical protein
MKGKFGVIALLLSSLTFAAPVSTPSTLNDTPIISGGSGTCGRIDLTYATSDYMLKPCEEAVYRYSNPTDTTIYIPLHIATEPNAVYEIKIIDTGLFPTWDRGHTALCPNNQSFPYAFRSVAFLSHETWLRTYGSVIWHYPPFDLIFSTPMMAFSYLPGCFYIDKFPGGIASAIVSIGNRVMMWDSAFDDSSGMQTVRFVGATRWLNKVTPWTSLGTIVTTLKSGVIIVKRIY